jgi:hypothetical protein
MDCWAATWVHGVDASGASQTVKCRGCGRGFTVRSSPNLSPDPREQHETALALAEGNGLDLPSAYSVLLGVTTLEVALVMRDRGLPATADEAEEPAKPVAAPGSKAKSSASSPAIASSVPGMEFDPAFRDAVVQGYLSVQQAIERGNRDKYAKRIVERHALSQELAYLVADNRTSLSMAIRKDREEVDDVLRPVKRAVWKKALVAILGSAAAVAITVYGFHVMSKIDEDGRQVEALTKAVSTKTELVQAEQQAQAEAGRPQGSVPPRRVRLKNDDQGRVIEIEGPDPKSVLLAYCAHLDPPERYSVLELTDPVPPFPGAKLGVFVDKEDVGRRYGIRIRRSIKGHRWVAGDGETPIEVKPLSPGGLTGTPATALPVAETRAAEGERGS